MSDPVEMNPHSVEQEILRLSRRLDDANQRILTHAKAAGEADAGHKVAYAKALLQADGAVAVREAHATVATEKQLFQKRAAEAILMAARDSATNIRAQLDALRSVNTNMRVLIERGAA